jgi:hypothetical protein
MKTFISQRLSSKPLADLKTKTNPECILKVHKISQSFLKVKEDLLCETFLNFI